MNNKTQKDENDSREALNRNQTVQDNFLTGMDYNWYLAWAVGRIPLNLENTFRTKLKEYQPEDNTTKDAQWRTISLFIALISLLILAESWVSIAINLPKLRSDDLEKHRTVSELVGAIVELVRVGDFGLVATINGVVVTAITIWKFVNEKFDEEFITLLTSVRCSKIKYLKACRRFVIQTKQQIDVKATPTNIAGEKIEKSLDRNSRRTIVRTSLQIRRQATEDDIQCLTNKCLDYSNRTIDLKSTENTVFAFAVIGSASVLALQTLVEWVGNPSCCEDRTYGVSVLYIAIPLMLLHYLVFSLSYRDTVRRRDRFKDVNIEDKSALAAKYVLRLIEFSTKEHSKRTPGRLRRFSDSIYSMILSILALVFMIAAIWRPDYVVLDGSVYQIVVTIFYIVVGLVCPTSLLYSRSSSPLYIQSLVKNRSFLQASRILVLSFCLFLNLMVPLSFMIVSIEHWKEMFWYLWWNPLLSLCAFWFCYSLVFRVCDNGITCSLSRWLSDIEYVAVKDLEATAFELTVEESRSAGYL